MAAPALSRAAEPRQRTNRALGSREGFMLWGGWELKWKYRGKSKNRQPWTVAWKEPRQVSEVLKTHTGEENSVEIRRDHAHS